MLWISLYELYRIIVSFIGYDSLKFLLYTFYDFWTNPLIIYILTFSQKKNGNRSTQPQIKKEHFWQYKFFFIINKQLETAAALSNKSQIIIQVSI